MNQLILVAGVVYLANSCWCFPAKRNGSDDELLAVAVLFRHGDRAPLKFWPNDIYAHRTSEIWPDGLGQLIKKGRKRQYELGKWLRKRYNGFLPSHYNVKDIHVMSSDTDRVLMSAELALSGLYPPEKNVDFREAPGWQPVPIHTSPRENDPTLAMHCYCKKYDMLSKEVDNSEEIKTFDRHNAELYRNLSVLTGFNITTYHRLSLIHSTLTIEKEMKLIQPKWVDEYFPDKIRAAVSLNYKIKAYNKDLARLRCGPFFNYVGNHFEQVFNGSAQKFLMLSGHDNTIAPVMQSLGVYNDIAPEFSQTLLWEVKRSDQNHRYVNLFLKNSTHFEKLRISGCDYDCDYDRYKEITGAIALDIQSWKKECDNVNTRTSEIIEPTVILK